ncbi:MAG: LuxR C-terminal-related transcriptional regulator [Saprospiraceae bacterium]
MKTILTYGIFLAVLTGILKFVEYRFLVRDLSTAFYVGTVAVFFTVLGIWMGLKLTTKKEGIQTSSTATNTTFPQLDVDAALQNSGLSKREHEVLTLMAQGHSNQEIADELCLSLNTVKTHSSNLFIKLDVKRRTQAVQRAKEMGIIA